MRKVLGIMGLTLPLLTYLCVAIWRVLWVPCLWQVHYNQRVFANTENFGTVALWRITFESPRYRLIAFEEGIFLALLVVLYGGLFLIFPQTRRRLTGWWEYARGSR